jgi:hypothetical protein
LTAVLEPGAGQADVGALASCCSVCFPPEDGEGSRANLAFGIIICFDHLNVWIVRETVFADRGEVGGLPTGAVEILLDLRRHFEEHAQATWMALEEVCERVLCV